jgi:dipeptidyl aminopeptidase/acylaminoacyl peptidase
LASIYTEMVKRYCFPNGWKSDQMVAALKQRGVTIEYLVKDNEGHGFHNEENRFDFYRSMENFPGNHLGGKKE